MNMTNKYSRLLGKISLSHPFKVLAVSVLLGAGVSPAWCGKPMLTVGIYIEGLDYEQLMRLRDNFGKYGFNRFLNEGVVVPAIDYGTSLDAIASTALAVTGASPSVNGIHSSQVYDPMLRIKRPVLSDSEYIGNYTTETYSPRNLLTSTVSDEAKIAGAGVGYVYSVATSPEMAILLGGHAADGAIWLNMDKGTWASSTFYPEIPVNITTRNRLTPLSMRLDTLSWVPLWDGAVYNDLPEHLTHYPFRYVFGRLDEDRYQKFAASPLGGEETVKIANDLITTQSLGTHSGQDAINVGLSALPYEYAKSPDTRFELQDTYLRLDRAVASLIATAEKQAGKDNCLFYIVSTPPSSTSRRDDPKYKIPYGEFSVKKAMSLLNLYLMAVYGNGEWVTASDGEHFYLNRETAKEHNISLRELRREAASFLNRMSGVRQAYSLDVIIEGDAGPRPQELKRNTPADADFDVLLTLRPGWELVDDYNYPVASTSKGKERNENSVKVERPTTPYAPAMFLAPSVVSSTLSTPADARSVAPTVARLMRIRAPNGADLPPLAFPDSKSSNQK